jgi:hypothetical protein
MSKPFYMGPTPPKLMTAYDYQRIAARYGLPEAKLRAVCEVEANGVGIHSTGAVTALYEPHIAYRYTSGAVRNTLVANGLAYPKWRRNYPKSSYPRIDSCAKIAGEEVAALSSSWALPQMMGFNHKRCGYNSALEMVKAFAQGEPVQIQGMMDFIASDQRMFTALHNNDWAGFAKRYNGPGYKKNNYDTKLANAYRKWVRIVDERGTVKPPDYGPEPIKPEYEPERIDETETHWLARIIKEFFKWLATR